MAPVGLAKLIGLVGVLGDEQKRDERRVQEHNSKHIKYRSSVLRYDYRTLGSRPPSGSSSNPPKNSVRAHKR